MCAGEAPDAAHPARAYLGPRVCPSRFLDVPSTGDVLALFGACSVSVSAAEMREAVTRR
jgi:hypothetical protein